MKKIIFIPLLLLAVRCTEPVREDKTGMSVSEGTMPDSEVFTLSKFEAFKDSILPARQEFKFKADKETHITCKNKTEIYIPANAFDTDGRDDSLTLFVTEYTTKENMYFSGLTTTSGGKMLESNGMVYLECRDNGKKLNLKKSARAAIAFPKNDQPEMNLFYGAYSADSILDWKLQDINEDKVKEEAKLKSLESRVASREWDFGV